MKELGIVICNYNKSSYVLKCIETVLASEYQDFDLYVVDNASTDDSVKAIRDTYGDCVNVLENSENLGGSGGFNTGLRKVLEKDYKYVCCLDNDVQVTPEAIGAMRDFLEENTEVGMVSAKVYHLQMQEYVQQMGLYIHFNPFYAETIFADVKDDGSLPEVVYCDTVAACALMMPVKVVREVGLMPEDNFIYWDDMEWGYLVKKQGYQVAAIGSAKVYHEMSANVRRENTFSKYYLWRNNLNFYMKYTPASMRDSMCFSMLHSVFDAMYGSLYREEHNVASTIQFAFLDAMMGKRGKAEEGKIRKNDENNRKFLSTLKRYQKICVVDEEQIGLKDAISKLAPHIEFVENGDADIVWKSCPYVMQVKDDSLTCIYVDRDWNVLVDAADLEMVKNYEYSLQLFVYMHQDTFCFESGRRFVADKEKN